MANMDFFSICSFCYFKEKGVLWGEREGSVLEIKQLK